MFAVPCGDTVLVDAAQEVKPRWWPAFMAPYIIWNHIILTLADTPEGCAPNLQKKPFPPSSLLNLPSPCRNPPMHHSPTRQERKGSVKENFSSAISSPCCSNIFLIMSSPAQETLSEEACFFFNSLSPGFLSLILGREHWPEWQ